MKGYTMNECKGNHKDLDSLFNCTECKDYFAPYMIRDTEAGNVIETGLTYETALDLLAEFEKLDKSNGSYEPDFYEIVPEKDNGDTEGDELRDGYYGF